MQTQTHDWSKCTDDTKSTRRRMTVRINYFPLWDTFLQFGGTTLELLPSSTLVVWQSFDSWNVSGLFKTVEICNWRVFWFSQHVDLHECRRNSEAGTEERTVTHYGADWHNEDNWDRARMSSTVTSNRLWAQRPSRMHARTNTHSERIQTHEQA